MTQQYNFILVFCNKSTHTFEGLSLPPPKSCADTSTVGCTRATHVRTDNIEFTSENINKFSIERIWGNLFGKSSCRAASRGVWRSWNTTTPAPGTGKLCSDRDKLHWEHWARSEHSAPLERPWNLWARAIGETLWNYILTHGTVSEKKKTCIWHPLAEVPSRTSPFTYFLTCISWPKPAAEVAS